MTNEIAKSIDYYPKKTSDKLIGIDATIGGGGHSYELLNRFPNLNIIGLDHDPFDENLCRRRVFRHFFTIFFC